MNQLIEKLEARRNALGMPLSVLAKRAGLTKRTVHVILSTGEGRFASLAAIAHALGTRLIFEADLTPEEMRLEQASARASREGCSADGLLTRGKTVVWQSEPPITGVLDAG